MAVKQDYVEKGYTEAEVEILVAINTIKINQDTILKNYVKRDEFAPIQKLVYGLVGLVLIAVASGAIALVIQ